MNQTREICFTEQDRRMLRGMRVSTQEDSRPERCAIASPLDPPAPECNPIILLVAVFSGVIILGGLFVIGTGISMLEAAR